MRILFSFYFLLCHVLPAFQSCNCFNPDCVQKSTMSLKGAIRQVEEIDSRDSEKKSKLSVVLVAYIEGISNESGRYQLLQNDTSLSIDWLPMTHDVVETSRKPPILKSVHFVNVAEKMMAVVIELLFDVLNMKLRSTYEIKLNSIFDEKCKNVINLPSHAAMNITFACERIEGSNCYDSIKIDHHPVCNLMRSYHTRVIENSRNSWNEVDVLVSVEKNRHRLRKIKYFVAFYGVCESHDLTNHGDCILDLHSSQISRFCVHQRIDCQYNKTFLFTLSPFHVSERYGIQICGVLDDRFENPPIVAGKSKVIADILSVSPTTSSLTISPSVNSLLRTLVGYAFVLAFLLIVLILFTFYKCVTYRRENQKSGDQYVMDEDSLTIFETTIIGKGQFGIVHLGQLSPDWHGTVVLDELQRVAIKTNQKNDKISKRQFFDEIEGAKVVGRHSRIVASIGTVMKNGVIHHVMEYCANGCLLDYLICKRKYMIELQEKGIDLNRSLTSINDVDFENVLSLQDLYRISSQICNGMIYLSSKSIIHNVLCAKHVLITSDHNVKIADFGFISTSTTPNSQPVENYEKWSALEVLRGELAIPQSDVWSYGVTLWEIFTMGGRPYYNIPDKSIRGLIEKGFRLQKPEGCVLLMYQLMRETWLDNPTDRPNFAHILPRISNIARQPSIEANNFLSISTLCDYYLDDFNSSSHQNPEILDNSSSNNYDAAALISESERLLGYRF